MQVSPPVEFVCSANRLSSSASWAPSSWISSTTNLDKSPLLDACEEGRSDTECHQEELYSNYLPQHVYQSWKSDRVLRVMDANTLKLENQGQVSLAAVQMPSVSSATFQFPECFDKAPSYKLRKLLPKGTSVRIRVVSSTSSVSNALVVREPDGTLINADLVKSGYARVKEKAAKQAEAYVPDLTSTLVSLQQEAQTLHLGIYNSCDAESAADTAITSSSSLPTLTAPFSAEFEPLQPEEVSTVPPSNPGDRRKCADFETYEEALKYYETFFPYYGDVARLDRDNDGVPCPGLPHTKNQDLYRMKVPKTQQGMSPMMEK